MHFPPDEWQIECDDQFGPAVAEDTAALAAKVLVQIDGAGKAAGCFKILLSGNETLKADFPAEKILIMGGAAAFRK